MMTRAAEDKLRLEQAVQQAVPTITREQMAAVAPDLATLEYRTSDDAIDDDTKKHLGKFDNRFVVFGRMSIRDREIYNIKHKKFLLLKAAMKGITRDELVAEPQAEGYLFAMTTMGLDGFTTKELTTQRVYEQGARPREAPGFWSRLLGRGAQQPQPEGAG